MAKKKQKSGVSGNPAKRALGSSRPDILPALVELHLIQTAASRIEDDDEALFLWEKLAAIGVSNEAEVRASMAAAAAIVDSDCASFEILEDYESSMRRMLEDADSVPDLEAHLKERYSAALLGYEYRSFMTSEQKFVEADFEQGMSDLANDVGEASSAVRLKATWSFLQAQFPNRLPKVVMDALVANENTPDEVKDEIMVDQLWQEKARS